jgi:hypothetical protein
MKKKHLLHHYKDEYAGSLSWLVCCSASRESIPYEGKKPPRNLIEVVYRSCGITDGLKLQMARQSATLHS